MSFGDLPSSEDERLKKILHHDYSGLRVVRAPGSKRTINRPHVTRTTKVSAVVEMGEVDVAVQLQDMSMSDRSVPAPGTIADPVYDDVAGLVGCPVALEHVCHVCLGSDLLC